MISRLSSLGALIAITATTATLAACGGSDRDHRPGTETDAQGNTRFFLPTGDEARNTVNPTIETDANGDLHMIYPAYAIGDAFYAFCDGDCDAPGDVKVVRFDTDGTVYNAMIALDGAGKPQILLSTYGYLYYGRCTGDCTSRSGWALEIIAELDGKIEVSGEAFALTADGKPRFLMHAYRAFLGIGAPPPATWWVTCDDDCTNAASWTSSQISSQIWAETTLRIGRDGRPRIATIATITDENGSVDMGAYLECSGDCTSESGWGGPALMPAFADRNVELIDPAIALALDANDGVKVSMLGKTGAGKRVLAYFECTSGCSDGDAWGAQGLIEDDRLGAGVDLALTRDGEVRVVYTAASNIFMVHCTSDCASANAPWKLAKVELGSDMRSDDIFLYPNCNVAAWFLRHPSIAIDGQGRSRVVYRAEDISGGWSNPDPTEPDCVAGADMTLTRLTRLDRITDE